MFSGFKTEPWRKREEYRQHVCRRTSCLKESGGEKRRCGFSVVYIHRQTYTAVAVGVTGKKKSKTKTGQDFGLM